MGILKLKNYLIVAVLLNVSSGYCASKYLVHENIGDDLFSPKPRMPFQTPTFAREDAGLVGHTTEYARALEQYAKSEQHRRISRQQFKRNIFEGITTLQKAELAARDEVHAPLGISTHTAGEYHRAFKQYTKQETRRRLASQRWRQNILGGLNTFNYQECAIEAGHHGRRPILNDTIVDHFYTPLALSSSVIDTMADKHFIAPPPPIRRPEPTFFRDGSDSSDSDSVDSNDLPVPGLFCPSLPRAIEDNADEFIHDIFPFAGSQKTPSSSSSIASDSSYTDSPYVSSEDEKPKKRGIISNFFHKNFS